MSYVVCSILSNARGEHKKEDKKNFSPFLLSES